jgi:3-methyl-2-oxobutanoate hydroxymethyltransferase
MGVLLFEKKKQAGEKISLLTCYDYTSACLLAETAIDGILIGDSVAMTMNGFENTVSATVDMIEYHTQAVRKGAPKKFLISDLPFLSFRSSLSKGVNAVLKLMQAGANAVKIEGATGNLAFIRHLVDSGVPVIGHLGLTVQLINTLGGFKIQGKTEETAQQLIDDAKAMEQAGCFALVLECIPSLLGQEITRQLTIPTIGIGAGPHTDGQILVWQDVLGLNPNFKTKFVKTFVQGHTLFKQGIEQYISEIQSGTFPDDTHSF